MSGTSKWPMSELKSALRRGAHRVGLLVEGPGVDRVVGFASKVEARHEEITEVALRADLAPEVIVEVLEAAGQLRVGIALEAFAAAHGFHQRPAPILLRVAEQRPEVELVRVGRLDRLAVALVPVADEVRVEHARPAHTALDDRVVEARAELSSLSRSVGWHRRTPQALDLEEIIHNRATRRHPHYLRGN